MQKDILKQLVALRGSLETERRRIQARLQEIEAALGGVVPSPATEGRPQPEAPGQRTISTTGRAAIIAAQKARWAKIKASKNPKAAAPQPAPKCKRKISPEARRRMIEGAKARWAKAKA